MPVKQLRKDLRLHLALGELVVASLVLEVVLCIRINGRNENDVFPIRRPDGAICSRGNVCDLMRLAVEPATFRSEIAHPDLSGVGRLRRPDQPFAVGRKPRTLFMIRRLVQTARFPARRGHNPQMRNPGVCLEIDIDCVEHDPLSIGRRNRRADAFQLHHVFEGEGAFAPRCGIGRWLRQERTGQRERSDQDFPRHTLISV
jgi:hypothetical protein